MDKTRVFRHVMIWVFTVAVLAVAVHPCFFAPVTLAESKKIRVVMDDNYPPYVFRDAEGQLVGILVDQWALWEKKTGVKVALTAKNWADAQQELAEG